MRLFFEKLLDLTELFLQKIQEFVQRYLGFNGDLKVLALASAFVVFMLIRATIGHLETYKVPVHATIDNQGYAIINFTPSEVEVELKGSADDIKSFDRTQLKVEVKIKSILQVNETNVTPSQVEIVTLSQKNIVGSGKLRFVKITPAKISVAHVKEFGMTMMVKQPELLGKPLQGEASVKLTSNEVKVTGPESQLKKLIEKSVLLPTEPIDVTGKIQGFKKLVKVLAPDDSGISRVTPMEVEAQVDITIVTPVESIYTNAPTPTVTDRMPLTVKPSTNDLTNAVAVPVEGDPDLDAEPSNSETNAESK